MIDFLKKINIKEDVLIEIIKNNNPSALSSLSINEDECLKIINYMREIGIACIDELLINRIDLFLSSFDKFIKKLSKFNIPVLVQLVNTDYATIDIINE